MSRWNRCTPLEPSERLARFRSRVNWSEEEMLRRQALGLRVREQIVQRAHQIPRHRALVVIEQPRSNRRRRKQP